MNILIAADLKTYRLSVKSYIHKLWPAAVVYEESSLDSVVSDVFEVRYDLLILDVNIPGGDELEVFVKQATKYTRVIILCENAAGSLHQTKLINLGADACLSKTASEDEVVSTLLFVCSEV